MKFTEQQLQLVFYLAYQEKYVVTGHNTFPSWNHSEMDLFGIRKSGYVDEVEIKISASDFKNDWKKKMKIKNGRQWTVIKKHDALTKGLVLCNRFSFLLPHTIVDECKIPDYAGLYVINSSGFITEKKKAKLLHKNKISAELKFELTRKMQYRYWRLLHETNNRRRKYV